MTEGYISGEMLEWEEDVWNKVHLWANEGECGGGHGWCRCTVCRILRDNVITDDDKLGAKGYKMLKSYVIQVEHFISSSKCRCQACRLLRTHGERKGSGV